jgi:hypothetical protein
VRSPPALADNIILEIIPNDMRATFDFDMLAINYDVDEGLRPTSMRVFYHPRFLEVKLFHPYKRIPAANSFRL